MGRSGPTGAQGLVGATGSQGPTLVGPTGPAGIAGVAGVQGTAGAMGGQGRTTAGVSGEVGRPGLAGAQGSVGSMGNQGVAGVVDRWTSYRDFTFAYDRADIQSSDATKVTDIAAYMKQNPSIQVGIDGSMAPNGSDPRNQQLSDSRVGAVRTALINAGVPSSRIKTGAFGDTALTKDRRVEVLIITSK
jgi:hypothetical protein